MMPTASIVAEKCFMVSLPILGLDAKVMTGPKNAGRTKL
jgi:hypothetical protein